MVEDSESNGSSPDSISEKQGVGDSHLLTWIIHESRLLQLRGVMDAAVAFHPESPSQQSRCSKIGSPLGGKFGRIFLGDIQGKW
jgi:hypothetical protein